MMFSTHLLGKLVNIVPLSPNFIDMQRRRQDFGWENNLRGRTCWGSVGELPGGRRFFENFQKTYYKTESSIILTYFSEYGTKRPFIFLACGRESQLVEKL